MTSTEAQWRATGLRKTAAYALAQGYAWAAEDITGTITQTPAGEPYPRGDALFAAAYAQARQDYDEGKRGTGPSPVKISYARWQETGGRTIESEADEKLAAWRAG